MSTEGSEARGPIAWMARNSVAANLLMVILLAGGLLGLMRVKQEVFPAFDLDMVTVQVPYPGASPAEVEQGIVLALEEAVRGIDGVKRVTSNSAEGAGTVSVELLLGADGDKVLADVKGAVDRVTSLPEQAERPNVTLLSRRSTVIKLILYGDQPLATLHAIAEQAREQILADPAVTQADIEGVPPLELSIEIPRETLEAYGLTLEQVAMAVRAQSIELPGGRLRTRGGELLVRVADRRTAAAEYADVIVRGTGDGGQVRLGDIARIHDGYEESDLQAFFDGQRAVRVVAYRVGDETPSAVADAVRNVAASLRAEIPDQIGITVWDDDSEVLADRIDLLARNARLGLVLVFLVLTVFLDLRLALWVGIGIPISFLGTFFLMPSFDLSVNMITLFAFIVTLGMVVDDAIVVGENIYAKEQEGLPRLRAAIEGAQEMAVPVTFSILTSIAAFAPLLLVPGVMGKIFGLMPMVVILVLFFSLVESFFVLPAHLGHGTPRTSWPWPLSVVDGVRKRAGAGLEAFTDRIYRPILGHVLRQRYITAAVCLGLFVMTVGVVAAGVVPFSFFPKLEGNLVRASARLPYGSPLERSESVARLLERAAREAVEQAGDPGIYRGMYTVVGQGPRQGWTAGELGGHLVTVEVGLVPTDQREISSRGFGALWEAAVPPIAGVEALTFESSTGPGAGAAVDVQLAHPDTDVLAAASEELAGVLRTYPSLTHVDNSYAAGKPQLDFKLLPAATTLNLTGNDLARQIRSSFFGAEALREQRGRNELKVMVRLPAEQRASEHDLEQLRIRSAQGGEVPLSYVATVDRGRAPTSIRREEGQRVVNVKAELAAGVTSSRDVLDSLTEDALPALLKKYPRLQAELVGEQREQGETFAALRQNYLLAMFAIFALLAIPFKSYVQPAIVMAAIPMGFVGAVAGHMIMGFELSVISFFGVIALSGVVVNDSLVLIDSTNRRRREGATAWEAIVYGGTRRLRPILLTSLTTFFGLAPMILETSIQARFLIPMAISLGFGVLFATVVILLLVPALYLMVEDLLWAARWLYGAPDAEEEAAPSEGAVPALAVAEAYTAAASPESP